MAFQPFRCPHCSTGTLEVSVDSALQRLKIECSSCSTSHTQALTTDFEAFFEATQRWR